MSREKIGQPRTGPLRAAVISAAFVAGRDRWSGFGSGHRILIVLSDAREEALFLDAFERLGWNVDLADDLQSLVAVLEKAVPEVALTDDLRVLRSIRHQLGIKSSIAVVVLTEDRKAVIEAAKLASADHVIVRPVDPDDPLGT